jgi:allantoate deiminase
VSDAEEPAAAPPAVPADTAPPKVDGSRVAEMLRRLSEIGKDPAGGISRLAFTDLERQAHELVADWMRELNLSVWQDAIGNTIGELRGPGSDLPAIGVGSHLDSVPHGGRFDGTVGVIAGLEVARWVQASNTALRHPLRVVAFAGEEGARFGEPCIGSKAVAGLLSPRDFARLRDAHGTTAAEAMRSVGMDPELVSQCQWRAQDWAAFLELHIEQARVLEAEGLPIGIVDVVSGSTRINAVMTGRAEHSGGTPMDLRADALTAAAEVTLMAEAIARDPRHRGLRTTIGRFDVQPNSITTIPGRVSLTLDVRDIDNDRQRSTAAHILEQAVQVCTRRGVELEAELLADTSPAVLPMWVREIVGQVCQDMGVTPRVMSSGAGHDAQIISRITPAGICFVPSRAGLSHAPDEWTSVSDIARGIELIARSVVRLDGFLSTIAD